MKNRMQIYYETNKLGIKRKRLLGKREDEHSKQVEFINPLLRQQRILNFIFRNQLV